MPRLPRFKRSPEIPPFKLTNRDREILRLVHHHRYLRSDHLVALTTGSQQQVLRRLKILFHHGFLERPRCQLDYYQSGSRRMAYGLGNKGMAWVKRDLALTYPQLNWKRKHHIGRLFLEHALLISDVMVAIELACRRREDVRLLTVDELPMPDRREPFGWQVDIDPRCGVIPDRIFGLDFNGWRCWYFLEADRATMPIIRANPSQTSFYRKLQAYAATWEKEIHHRKFGIQRFRVLTVTTNPERVRKMIEACRNIRHGKGLFLFTDIKSFQEQPDPFVLRWQTHQENESVSLLD